MFGPNLDTYRSVHTGDVWLAVPAHACIPLTNANELKGKIAAVFRGSCMFVEKVRYVVGRVSVNIASIARLSLAVLLRLN